MTPRIGSLCSGYGGLEMGLMAVVGGSVAWHVEYDKHPAAVLEARFPGVPNYGDITTTDWTQVEPVDWLTAGYPCQPFSHAGKRKGKNDERHLWPFVAGAIGVLRPRRVLLENVRGHVSLGLADVLADLSGLGYDATWGVVRAADAGAPHNRARIFIVAADTRGERHGGREDGRSVGRVDGQDAGEARQRERSRAVAGDRSAAAPADAGGGPLTGLAAARDGLSVAPERGDGPPADSDQPGRQGSEPARRRDLPTWGVAADSDDHTARAGREPGESPGCGAEPPQHGHGPSTDPRGERLDGRARLERARGSASERGEASSDAGNSPASWGAYEPAIRRWERVLGRPAPRPTEPGRTGERLSPRFVEWMMGLPDGHVTDILPRNPALKALGNGVVPQQAALAVRTLLHVGSVAA